MGYDVTRFTEQPDGEFLCSICLGVFEDPVQGTCGHVYCSACIKNWLIPGLPTYQVEHIDNLLWQQPPPALPPGPQQQHEAINGVPVVVDGSQHYPPLFPRGHQQPQLNVNPRSSCPLDKKPLSRNGLTPIPLPLKGLLYKLEIKCAFDSCTYKCQLSDINHHESICEYNPSSEVTCPKCSRKMIRSERSNHDCIEVLKGIVERLEREVERLKKKRRFGPSALGSYPSPGQQQQPSTSSGNNSFAGQPIVQLGSVQPLPLPPPPMHSIVGPLGGPSSSQQHQLPQPPIRFNRSSMPSTSSSTQSSFNSMFHNSVRRTFHGGHGGHPYHHSRSPHTPPRVSIGGSTSASLRASRASAIFNGRNRDQQQVDAGGFGGDDNNNSGHNNFDLQISPPSMRSSPRSQRQLRVIPSLPVPIPNNGNNNNPIAGPSHNSPRNSIGDGNAVAHHQIVAIGSGSHQQHQPHSRSFSDHDDVIHVYDN